MQIKKNVYFCPRFAEVAQLVEHNLAKVRVAGSSPVFRSNFQVYTTDKRQRLLFIQKQARVAELVDALVSGASGVITVQVRVLFRALMIVFGNPLRRW